MINNKKVVGILPTYDYSDTDPYANRDRFVRMYEKIINECGAIPIGLLNRNIKQYFDLCDAYIWPGGNIIEKDFYCIFDDILTNKKPLLGVCMGAQAISIFFNTLEEKQNNPDKSIIELYDNNKKDNPYLKIINDEYINKHFHIVTFEDESINGAKHEINIIDNSFMHDIYKTNKINRVSLHKYQIARTSKDILVSARSNDNVIEAIEYHKDNNHILGIQYHPEVTNDSLPFKWLIDNINNK